MHVTNGNVADVNVLNKFLPEAGAFYVMDRGYIDFQRLYRFTLELALFVVRAKTDVLLQRRYSHPAAGVRSDQTAILASMASASAYPDALRKVSFVDSETGKSLVLLTNNFSPPAATIAAIYKQRWQVELFFKWIKEHLRIKAFYKISENAAKTQIWIPGQSSLGRIRCFSAVVDPRRLEKLLVRFIGIHPELQSRKLSRYLKSARR